MKKLILLTIISLGVFIACNDDKLSGDGSSKVKIARMEIKDAAALFIAPANFSQSGSTRAASYETNVLFEITKDGVIKRVSYLDELGNEINQSLVPTEVLTIDDSQYFFVRFNDGTTYMVQENSGAIYETPWIPFITREQRINAVGLQNYINDDNIKIDGNGNIYYLDGYTIYKIDISEVNKITKESLTPESDDVNMFMVSNTGHLFYRYYRDGYRSRLRNTSGRLFPFSTDDDGYYMPARESIAFKGFDGNIHILDRRALYAIIFNNDGSYETKDILWDNCMDQSFGHGSTHFCLSNTVYELVRECYLIKLRDRYLLINSNGLAMVVDSKYDSSILELAAHDVTGGMKITQLEYNDSYIFCCGNKGNDFSLLRINPYTYESEPLVHDNDYEIYSFTVLNDNTITFNGLRLSDGKIILATIDGNGKVSVIKETGNTKVTLHRVQ